MKIKIIDPVDCEVIQATVEEHTWLKELLSYEQVFFQKQRFGSKKREYRASMLKRKLFPTGFLPRIYTATQIDSIALDIIGQLGELPYKKTPQVTGITFRNDQIKIINDVHLGTQRGVIESPTGSGKTVIMMGIMSTIPQSRVLVVVHTKDLLLQTFDEFKKHGFDPLMSGGKNKLMYGKLVVATRQSLVETYDTLNSTGKKLIKRKRVKPEHRIFLNKLDAIFIDEAHLFGDMGGQNATLLRSNVASMRLGFTGTAPDPKSEVGMALEGMVGPVIGQLKYEEAKELDILAPIKLELIPVPTQKAISRHTTWKNLRSYGLIFNRTRNKLIMQRALALQKENTTCLIFVEAINHGDALLEMAEVLGVNAVSINGEDWEAEERNAIKAQLEKGEINCVITTKVWREGINIPNLGAVILAGGGKARLSTLQAIGRGLRKAPGKEYAVIVDMLDPYDYLAKHSIQRLSIYHEMGWLK